MWADETTRGYPRHPMRRDKKAAIARPQRRVYTTAQLDTAGHHLRLPADIPDDAGSEGAARASTGGRPTLRNLSGVASPSPQDVVEGGLEHFSAIR